MDAADQQAQVPNQPKLSTGPEFPILTRCPLCYSHQKNRRSYMWGDGESSSSAEDSGPEVACESESESSSSSSCSEIEELVEKPEIEKPSPLCGEAAEAESGGKDGDAGEETISCSSHLIPMNLLPRPNTVVSTLNLQVLSHNDESFNIVTQHKLEGDNNPPPTLPQQQLSHQYQQQPHQPSQQHQLQQSQHIPPLSAPGQRLPLPLNTPPWFQPQTLHAPLQVPNALQSHLHAPTSQPCWYCDNTQFPYSPYCHHSSGQLPKQ